MKSLSCAALAASLAFAAPVFAQPAPTPAPAAPAATEPQPSTAPSTATPSNGAAPTAQDARSAGSDVSVTTGMPVKDNTGASIGQVTAVNADSGGSQVATVKMGDQSFAVPTDRLAVQGGSATINATKAQIEQMIAKH